MKKLLVGSLFTFTFSFLPVLCKGQQTGLKIDSLSSGMTSPGAYVLSLAVKNANTDNLYAGGHFNIAGRDTTKNIAEWIDTLPYDYNHLFGKWVPLGTGVDSDVCALAMVGKYLYAGGKFDSAGGIASSHIARWDTASLTWDSLVGKFNGNVYALCVYKNQLYAGGDFTIADGDTVNRIAVWKDSLWAAVGKGFDTGAVYALAVSNDTLYAGGSFLKSNGMKLNHVAKLDGNSWDSMGGGTNNTVYALADDENYTLYVGGAFTKSGKIETKHISEYSNITRSWGPVDFGANDTVRAIDAGNACVMCNLRKPRTGQVTSGGNTILIGGNFDSAFGIVSRHIACLNCFEDSLQGVNGPVFAITNPNQMYYDYENYIGGRFSWGDDSWRTDSTVNANNVAYFGISFFEGIPIITNNSEVNVFPNPSRGLFTIEMKNVQMDPYGKEVRMNSIEVYNMLGEKVYSSSYPLTTNHYSLDMSSQPNGIYLYRAISQNGELIGQGKLIIQK